MFCKFKGEMGLGRDVSMKRGFLERMGMGDRGVWGLCRGYLVDWEK